MQNLATHCLVFLGLVLPGLSLASSCETPDQRPIYEIKAVTDGEPRIDQSQTSRELSRRALDRWRGGLLLGETQATFGMAYSISADACMPKVILELELKQQVIKVSTDLDIESCAYQETIEHEMVHVELNRKVLEKARQAAESVLQSVRFDDVDSLKLAVLQKAVPAASAVFQSSRTEHAQFDAQSHHEARQSPCKAEVAALMAK